MPSYPGSGGAASQPITIISYGAAAVTVAMPSSFTSFNGIGCPNTLCSPVLTSTAGTPQSIMVNLGNYVNTAYSEGYSGTGTVTNVATASPITGGPITATGTIACATCVVATVNPSAGLLRVAGSTQTATGAELSGDATTSGSNAVTVVKVNGGSVPASKTVVGTNSSSQLVDATSSVQLALSLAPGTYTNGDWCSYTSSGTLLNCNNAVPQASLSLAPGTYTNGDTCTYASSGTLLNCNGPVTANLVVASSPGAGVAHFAGSTQTVTSSAVSLTADVSGVLPPANGGTGAGVLTGIRQANGSSADTVATGHQLQVPLACADSSGSGTAQTCSTGGATYTPAAYDCIVYSTTTTNSGTGLTVNVDSLGAKSIAIPGSSGWTTTLTASVIPANKPQILCDDGTNWDDMQTGTASSGGSSGLSGMTATQVPIAATATTVTSSESLAGAGAGITTGPVSGVTSLDLTEFTGTGGQIADSSVVAANVITDASNLGAAGILYQTGNKTAAASTNATLTSGGTAVFAGTVSGAGIIDTGGHFFAGNSSGTTILGSSGGAFPSSGNAGVKIGVAGLYTNNVAGTNLIDTQFVNTIKQLSGSLTVTGFWHGIEMDHTFGLGSTTTYNGSTPMDGLLIAPIINVNTSSTSGYAELVLQPTETSVGAGLTNYAVESFASGGSTPTFSVTPSGLVNGTPAIAGIATLSSGTVTVSTAAACTPSATCVYRLTNCALNGSTVVGVPAIGTVSVGTSFVINSLTALAAVSADTSKICWAINL